MKTTIQQLGKDGLLGLIPGVFTYNMHQDIVARDKPETLREKVETALFVGGYGGFADLASSGIGAVALTYAIEGYEGASIGVGAVMLYKAICNMYAAHEKRNALAEA